MDGRLLVEFLVGMTVALVKMESSGIWFGSAADKNCQIDLEDKRDFEIGFVLPAGGAVIF